MNYAASSETGCLPKYLYQISKRLDLGRSFGSLGRSFLIIIWRNERPSSDPNIFFDGWASEASHGWASEATHSNSRTLTGAPRFPNWQVSRDPNPLAGSGGLANKNSKYLQRNIKIQIDKQIQLNKKNKA